MTKDVWKTARFSLRALFLIQCMARRTHNLSHLVVSPLSVCMSMCLIPRVLRSISPRL